MISKNPKVVLDGTSGGEIPVSPDLPNTQVAFAGRATGTLTITGKSYGSDVFEAFQPALTIDLSTERTAAIEGYSLVALNVTVSVGGDDVTATATQWNTQ